MLVAVAIPVFTGQLEKSKIATDKANVRAWYAEQTAAYLSDGTAGASTYDGEALKASGASVTVSGTLAGGDYKVVYDNSSSDGITLNSKSTSGS